MLNNPFFLTVVAGVGFAVWPLLVRQFGLSPIVASFAICVGTVVPTAIGMFLLPRGNYTTGTLVAATAVGLVNGIAFVAYAILLSNPRWDLSVYAPMTVLLMLGLVMLGGVVLYGESLSWVRCVGMALALGGVWLLLYRPPS